MKSNATPQQLKFPMTLDKCLRLWFPQLQGRTADRAAIIKRALRESEMLTRWKLGGDNSKPPEQFTPSADEVTAIFAKQRAWKVENEQTFMAMRHSYLTYFNWWKSQTRRAAAKQRWQSDKRKTATAKKKNTRKKSLAKS